MNATQKRAVVAGILALAMMVAPAAHSAAASESGLSLGGGQASSTAYARSIEQAPGRSPRSDTSIAPASVTPTGGGKDSTSTARIQGFQSGSGTTSDAGCQAWASIIQDFNDRAGAAANAGDSQGAATATDIANTAESQGMDEGCAFIY